MHPQSDADVPVYCSYPLDRAAHLRTEEAQANLRNRDSASMILLNNGSALCTKGGKDDSNERIGQSALDIFLASVSPARLFMDQAWVQQIVFLGVDRTGSPVYAGHTDSKEITLPDDFKDAEWLDIRTFSVSMCTADAALAGTANGMLQWHQTNVFSEDTGDRAACIDAGWARKSASSTRCLTPHSLCDHCIFGSPWHQFCRCLSQVFVPQRVICYPKHVTDLSCVCYAEQHTLVSTLQ